MYGAADLRIENVPHPAVIEPIEGPSPASARSRANLLPRAQPNARDLVPPATLCPAKECARHRARAPSRKTEAAAALASSRPSRPRSVSLSAAARAPPKSSSSTSAGRSCRTSPLSMPRATPTGGCHKASTAYSHTSTSRAAPPARQGRPARPACTRPPRSATPPRRRSRLTLSRVESRHPRGPRGRRDSG